MRSHKVRPGQHVVVVVDSDDDITHLFVSVKDTHVAPLDATPWEVRVKFRVLHMRQVETLAAE